MLMLARTGLQPRTSWSIKSLLTLLFWTGSGILRAISYVIQDVLKSKCTSSMLLEKYGKLCCIIDEVINEVRQQWGWALSLLWKKGLRPFLGCCVWFLSGILQSSDKSPEFRKVHDGTAPTLKSATVMKVALDWNCAWGVPSHSPGDFRNIRPGHYTQSPQTQGAHGAWNFCTCNVRFSFSAACMFLSCWALLTELVGLCDYWHPFILTTGVPCAGCLGIACHTSSYVW